MAAQDVVEDDLVHLGSALLVRPVPCARHRHQSSLCRASSEEAWSVVSTGGGCCGCAFISVQCNQQLSFVSTATTSCVVANAHLNALGKDFGVARVDENVRVARHYHCGVPKVITETLQI